MGMEILLELLQDCQASCVACERRGVACPCYYVANLAMGSSDAGYDCEIYFNIEGGAIYSWSSACTTKRVIMVLADN